MASRWDFVHDLKAVPLTEHLVEEMSKLLAGELGQWPLPIQELDVQTGRQFAPLLDGTTPRPSDAVFTEAFRLARWDLGRDLAAADEYMRNGRWAERGLSADDKPALLFISRWLVEQLLALREATEGRLPRTALVDCLGRIEKCRA